MCDSINPVPTNPESYPTSALSSAQSTFGLSPAGGIWLSNPWHGSSRVRAASTHLPSNQRMPEVRRWTRARIPAFPLRDARPIGGIALGEINPLMSRVRQFGGVSARNISEYLVPPLLSRSSLPLFHQPHPHQSIAVQSPRPADTSTIPPEHRRPERQPACAAQ